ncbi:hypothetical protein LTR08_000745 [Meristemomyces frigidus]|nr:hypothetical protein LTR08_000745 [Meristemomyces frigidus]
MSAVNLDEIKKRYNFKQISVATWRDPKGSILPARGGPASPLISAAAAASPYTPTYKVNYRRPPEPTDDEESGQDSEEAEQEEGGEDEQPETKEPVDSPIEPTADGPLPEHPEPESSLPSPPDIFLDAEIEQGTTELLEKDVVAPHATVESVGESEDDIVEIIEAPPPAPSPPPPEESRPTTPANVVEVIEVPPPAPLAEVEPTIAADGIPTSSESPETVVGDGDLPESSAQDQPEPEVSEPLTADLPEPPAESHDGVEATVIDAPPPPPPPPPEPEEKKVSFAPGTPEPKPTHRKKKDARGGKGKSKKRSVAPADDWPDDIVAIVDADGVLEAVPPPPAPPPPDVEIEHQAEDVLEEATAPILETEGTNQAKEVPSAAEPEAELLESPEESNDAGSEDAELVKAAEDEAPAAQENQVDETPGDAESQVTIVADESQDAVPHATLVEQSVSSPVTAALTNPDEADEEVSIVELPGVVDAAPAANEIVPSMTAEEDASDESEESDTPEESDTSEKSDTPVVSPQGADQVIEADSDLPSADSEAVAEPEQTATDENTADDVAQEPASDEGTEKDPDLPTEDIQAAVEPDQAVADEHTADDVVPEPESDGMTGKDTDLPTEDSQAAIEPDQTVADETVVDNVAQEPKSDEATEQDSNLAIEDTHVAVEPDQAVADEIMVDDVAQEPKSDLEAAEAIAESGDAGRQIVLDENSLETTDEPVLDDGVVVATADITPAVEQNANEAGQPLEEPVPNIAPIKATDAQDVVPDQCAVEKSGDAADKGVISVSAEAPIEESNDATEVLSKEPEPEEGSPACDEETQEPVAEQTKLPIEEPVIVTTDQASEEDAACVVPETVQEPVEQLDEPSHPENIVSEPLDEPDEVKEIEAGPDLVEEEPAATTDKAEEPVLAKSESLPQAPEPLVEAPLSPTLSKSSSHKQHADHWERKASIKKPVSSEAKAPEKASASKRSSRNSRDEPRARERSHKSQRHSTIADEDAERRRRREARKAEDAARFAEEERKKAYEEQLRAIRHEARREARRAAAEEAAKIKEEEAVRIKSEEAARIKKEAAAKLASDEAEAIARKDAEVRRRRRQREREAHVEAPARPHRERRESVTMAPLFFRTNSEQVRSTKEHRPSRSSRHDERPASKRSSSPKDLKRPTKAVPETIPPSDAKSEEERAEGRPTVDDPAPSSSKGSKSLRRHHDEAESERPRTSRRDSERRSKRPVPEEKLRSFFSFLLRGF